MYGAANMVETMKMSLLSYFDTGNQLFNVITAWVVISLSTYLLTVVQKLDGANIIRWLSSYCERKKLTANEIVISGRKCSSEYGRDYADYSDTFQALLYRIQKLNCVDSKIFKLREILADKNKESTEGSNLIVGQHTAFKLEENVEGIVEIRKEEQKGDQTSNGKRNEKNEEIEIIIRSTVLSMDELRDLLHKWLKEYKKSIAPDEYLRYFLHSTVINSETPSSFYSEFRFETGKSFNNLFFPEKDALLKRLNFFKDSKDWYKDRGIPYTLGIMLYGEPGCGKTSTIKAIANHTQRHIVSVPLSQIKTCKELLDIFYGPRINRMEIPLEKRLYVLEDIDCSEIKDIVKDRSNETAEDDDVSSKGSDKGPGSQENVVDEVKSFINLFNTKEGPTMKDGKFDWSTSKLTLAGILEVMDGVMEMDGRMLVITTNYPERLDAALTRPGRVDVKLKFDKCTKASLIEMYEHFFNNEKSDELWPEAFDPSTLPDKLWTPAEATQIFLSNMDKPSRALTQLLSKPIMS